VRRTETEKGQRVEDRHRQGHEWETGRQGHEWETGTGRDIEWETGTGRDIEWETGTGRDMSGRQAQAGT
jgi:hypothetical protein